MNSNKFFFLAFLLLTTVISFSSSSLSPPESLNDFNYQYDERLLMKSNRVLAQKPRATMTCDNYPRVCSAKGSAGPDCCNRQCVNVMNDRVNCGMCGKKCKYQEICCKGSCVNPSFDEKNCGKCNSRCKKGSSCLYGMCSYA